MAIEHRAIAPGRLLTITFKVPTPALNGFKRQRRIEQIFLPDLVAHFERCLQAEIRRLETAVPAKTIRLRRSGKRITLSVSRR